MAVSTPQLEVILSRAWERVSQATGLTNKSESGIAYNILAAFCTEIINLWNQLETAEKQSNLSTATGSNLDSIGQFFGVTRRQQKAATTIGTTAAVKFTNNSLTEVSIPERTRIWPTNAPERAYFTVETIIIPPGGQGYVNVTAAEGGSFYNTAANTLTNHNAILPDVTVTNEIPISNGRDIESDENYRVRITREILRKEGANLTAIREALMDIPGVRNAIIMNLARGTGTLDVYIYSYSREVTDELLAECQRVLDEEVAAGISAIAKPPTNIPVDVAVKLVLRPSAVFSQVRSLVSEAIRGYIDNLEIEMGNGEGTLVFQELASRVQESSPDIVDSTVSLTIDNIPALRANQTLDIGERFVSRVLSIT